MTYNVVGVVYTYIYYYILYNIQSVIRVAGVAKTSVKATALVSSSDFVCWILIVKLLGDQDEKRHTQAYTCIPFMLMVKLGPRRTCHDPNRSCVQDTVVSRSMNGWLTSQNPEIPMAQCPQHTVLWSSHAIAPHRCPRPRHRRAILLKKDTETKAHSTSGSIWQPHVKLEKCLPFATSPPQDSLRRCHLVRLDGEELSWFRIKFAEEFGSAHCSFYPSCQSMSKL